MWKKIKDWYKTVEAWLYSVGVGVLVYAPIDPMTALTLYNMLPAVLQTVLPHNVLIVVGVAVFGLALIAQLVKKRRASTKR